MSETLESRLDRLSSCFKLIGKETMLISSTDGTRTNAMTASWGGLGTVWGKNVCFIFVRPSRYTYDIIEKSSHISLSFFRGEYLTEISVFGKKSGRDCDKIAESGLHASVSDGYVTFDEAKITVKADILYHTDIDPNGFIDGGKVIERDYKGGDYHRMYVCEITDVTY